MKIVIAIPVLNEEQVLRSTVEQVLAAAGRIAGAATLLVIADNGSADRTGEIGRALAAEHGQVRYRRLEARGKGLAIRTAWAENPADVAVFMDADLATDLEALPALVRAAAEGGGMALGSRYLPGSRVERSFFRRVLSRGYRAFVRAALGTAVSDLPCGFKAAAAAVVSRIMPAVSDNGWFFDTELVIRTERAGLAVREIPVAWSDSRTPDRKSKVAVIGLIREYVRKVVGLRRQLRVSGGPKRI
jgi:glycosyltransferase involved in cell wall biosynthesis